MNAASIKTWLEDGRTVETYEISPGYQAVIRQEYENLTVYAVSSKQARPITTIDTLQEARDAIADYGGTYLAWLQKRRLQAPTPAQLGMLFSWKIPIPLDLTYGQAWDTIDARMKEESTSRAEKRRANIHLVKA